MQAPNFFAKTPPAPAGVTWWKYNSGVPPLPDPTEVLGQNYSGYEWKYDSEYQAKSYTFSDLDKVSWLSLPEPHYIIYQTRSCLPFWTPTNCCNSVVEHFWGLQYYSFLSSWLFQLSAHGHYVDWHCGHRNTHVYSIMILIPDYFTGHDHEYQC